MPEPFPAPGSWVPTVPSPCGCRTSGIDGYVYPCAGHRSTVPEPDAGPVDTAWEDFHR